MRGAEGAYEFSTVAEDGIRLFPSLLKTIPNDYCTKATGTFRERHKVVCWGYEIPLVIVRSLTQNNHSEFLLNAQHSETDFSLKKLQQIIIISIKSFRPSFKKLTCLFPLAVLCHQPPCPAPESHPEIVLRNMKVPRYGLVNF
jgi:hypothetical protein